MQRQYKGEMYKKSQDLKTGRKKKKSTTNKDCSFNTEGTYLLEKTAYRLLDLQDC